MKLSIKNLIFVILIVLISNGIVYSQKVEVDISPESVDFGTIPVGSSYCSSNKQVTVCVTNIGKISICITCRQRVLNMQNNRQEGEFPAFGFMFLGGTAVFMLDPNEKLEFLTLFCANTVGQKSGTLELLAGPKVDMVEYNPWHEYFPVVTDTIKINLSGNCTDQTVSVKEMQDIPVTYRLSQNYPNPFNPTTNIQFTIPKDEYVKLTVYDITGKFVQELVNGYKAAGTYYVGFDASNHATGTYCYKLEAGYYKSIQKMMVVK